MEFQPNPSFPLLASDQEDVMRLFLELMSQDQHAEQVCDVKTTSESQQPPFDANDARFLGGMLDFE